MRGRRRDLDQRRGESITLKAPAGSGLERYVDFLKRDAEGEQPLWQRQDRDLRRLGLRELLEADARLCSLPTKLFRDEILIPVIHGLGMPDQPPEPWLDEVLTLAAVGVQALDELDHPKPLPTNKRPGHPPPDSTIMVVVWAAYIEARIAGGDGTRNAANEAAARRLGPGVSRHTIERLIRRCRTDLHFKTAIIIADRMKACDDEQAAIARARKSARHASVFRPMEDADKSASSRRAE